MIELIISVVVLTGIMLVLTRFSWQMFLTEQNATNRIKAISCISAFIDEISKNGNIQSFEGKKIGHFKIDCRICSVGDAILNMPELIKNNLKKEGQGQKRAEFTISYISGFGTEQSFCIVTNAIGGYH